MSQSKGGAHLPLLCCYLLYLQPVLLPLLLLLPPPPSPSLYRDFDRPKVSLKAELFNSVSCRECLRRRWPCAILRKEDGTMKQSSVWGSKVHGAGGNQHCQELLYYIHHSQHYTKGKCIMYESYCYKSDSSWFVTQKSVFTVKCSAYLVVSHCFNLLENNIILAVLGVSTNILY